HSDQDRVSERDPLRVKLSRRLPRRDHCFERRIAGLDFRLQPRTRKHALHYFYFLCCRGGLIESRPWQWLLIIHCGGAKRLAVTKGSRVFGDGWSFHRPRFRSPKTPDPLLRCHAWGTMADLSGFAAQQREQ